ncbi:MAG: SMI1/KNR4 family protein [Bosea sp.]|uniref:SMI1/KNR4 family protein n=1 Tax=Bosea sp. (in: a-proteobacteria) TaxID=1871050 RepID=UPI0023A13325|nr:SMI1/KNR4 family protein [Bosea sp. (in: a-proteobacteria)]MCP4737598.1 SMI1/KNR4 family protein [Bosea sp. (in: a-proteobacteria)]
MERENGRPEEAELLDLESQIGRTLPEAYRNWLAETGGGVLIDSAIRSGLEDEPIADIAEMFSISNILKEINILENRIPATWLPIGISNGGDIAVIDLISGEILYLFVPYFYGKDFATRDLSVKIAEDFERLRRDLKPFDDVLKEIRN